MTTWSDLLEGVEGGLDAAGQRAVMDKVNTEALDFIALSAGSYEAGEWIVQSGEWAPGLLACGARRSAASRTRRRA